MIKRNFNAPYLSEPKPYSFTRKHFQNTHGAYMQGWQDGMECLFDVLDSIFQKIDRLIYDDDPCEYQEDIDYIKQKIAKTEERIEYLREGK